MPTRQNRQRLPQPDEIWTIPAPTDPWGRDHTVRSLIREVRDGWVRYDMLGGSIFTDQHMTLPRFVATYYPPI